jgi:DNA end-binding protein Ku
VALHNARHDRTSIRFNLINPDTGNRIRMITQDAETGDELERRNLVKGYEFRKNQYLILSNEDLDSVKVESSSVMTVEKFVDADSIDPVYYDAAYHLAPDGDAGRDVYAVLREAIAKTGKVALSRVVIAQRERTIALRPVDGGLMGHTLYEDRDLNSGQEVFDGLDGNKVDPEMVQLATQLVQRQAGKYDASDGPAIFDHAFSQHTEPRWRSPTRSAGQFQSGCNEPRLWRGVLTYGRVHTRWGAWRSLSRGGELPIRVVDGR